MRITFTALAAIASLTVSVASLRAGECPTRDSRGKPLTILFDDGSRVNILREHQDVLYYDAIDRDGRSTRMAVASGLFTMASIGPLGAAWFKYDSEPRLMKSLATGDVIAVEATVSRTVGSDYRMRSEIAVGEMEKIVVAGCSFDIIKLTATFQIVDGQNKATSKVVRYFEPDLRVTLRTIGSPRVTGMGPMDPSFRAIGFQ